MHYISDTFITKDEVKLATYLWECEQPKGVIHVVHGMSEHAGRYDEFALKMNQFGYLVFASDLRGHGKTAGTLDKVGIFAMQDGWKKVVSDVGELTKYLAAKYPKLPLILLGHSMGSFLVRELSFSKPPEVNAYILSGTAGHPGLLGVVGLKLAKFNVKLMGKKNRTGMMTQLAFGDNNKKIKNKRTEKDWLCKDEDIVDTYINDPFCMQVFTSQFYCDLLSGILHINETINIRKMETEKPILLFAGDMDPVGDYGAGPKEVFEKFKKAGVKDVTLKMYEGGRHEMLNETNREEVYGMIIEWLDSKFNR